MPQGVHTMLDGLLKRPEKLEYHNKMYPTSIRSQVWIVMLQAICFNSNQNNV